MFTKITFNVAGAVLVAFMICLIVSGTDGYWAALFAGAMLFLIGNADRIHKLKLSADGIEAETRELRRETRDTLEELRELATIVATNTLSLVMRAGRFGTYTNEEKEGVKNDVTRLLRKLGVEDAKIDQSLNDWHRFVEHDYRRLLTGGIKVPKDLPQGMSNRWEEVRKGGIARIASPDEVESFLREAGMLTDERAELVADYRYYREHKQFRRPDVWAAHAEKFD